MERLPEWDTAHGEIGARIGVWYEFFIGSALTTWADRYTDREMTGTSQSLFSNLKLAKSKSLPTAFAN